MRGGFSRSLLFFVDRLHHLGTRGSEHIALQGFLSNFSPCKIVFDHCRYGGCHIFAYSSPAGGLTFTYCMCDDEAFIIHRYLVRGYIILMLPHSNLPTKCVYSKAVCGGIAANSHHFFLIPLFDLHLME